MRLYARKILFICFALVFLWCIASLTSMVEVSPNLKKRSRKADEIEKKIDNLQKEVSYQLHDSNHFLEKLKDHLKRTNEAREPILPNEDKEQGGMKAEKAREVCLDSSRSWHSAFRAPFSPEKLVLPILVIACDRVTVRRCLENLVRFRPDKDTFPIIVSQDCNHNKTYHTIKEFTSQDPSITVVRQPDQSEILRDRSQLKYSIGYFKIARHYKFALNHVLVTLGHQAVIIVEDDLDIAPDFYEYFLGTYPLLVKDPTLWCVSAWNDNGKKELVDLKHPEMLHRTDFFPGLGWMLQRSTWQQLAPHWPEAFFDDWLRNPANTGGRACIRPEVSRTYSFGKVGVSKGLFFDNHLRYMQLNVEYVEFTKLDLSYLLKSDYDEKLKSLVESLPAATAAAVISGAGSGAARVPYTSADTYQRAAKKLGLMDDFRVRTDGSGNRWSGIPRTAYLGIVQCHVRGRRVYLAPAFRWRGYDPAWGK